MSEDVIEEEVTLKAATSVTIEKADDGFIVSFYRPRKGYEYHNKKFKQVVRTYNMAVAITSLALSTEDNCLKSEVA